MGCNSPGFSVHGIFQASILEWVAIFSFKGFFPTQGSNWALLRLPHWQVDSLPLCHLVSPYFALLYIYVAFYQKDHALILEKKSADGPSKPQKIESISRGTCVCVCVCVCNSKRQTSSQFTVHHTQYRHIYKSRKFAMRNARHSTVCQCYIFKCTLLIRSTEGNFKLYILISLGL